MNFNYRQSSTQTIRQYIDDQLPRDIISQNQECYSIMKFVDFDAITREVTVLIAGDDPQMHSTICRDVFIDGFVRVFVRPLLKQQFTDLDSVNYIKTTNANYDNAVRVLGGRVEYFNYWTSPHSFYDCMKLFGDNHPLIQGCLKSTFSKSRSPSTHDNYTATKFTTPSFFSRFDLGWFVTNETHVLGTNGEVFWGVDEIRKNNKYLPKLLTLRETEGAHKWVLIAASPSFFTDAVYKTCHFE